MLNKIVQKTNLILIVYAIVLLAFWTVALFFGNRFSVEGSLSTDDVNEVLGKATDFAEGIKEEAFPRDEEQK